MKANNIALWISFLRIVIAPVVLIYLSSNPYKTEIVLGIVVLAAFTDFLDGFIARHQNMVSKFGAVLDYTADKIFVISTLIILSISKELPYWITIVIFYREILVMGMRVFATHKNLEIPATKLGKSKTAVLFVAIIALLLGFEYNYYIFLVGVILTVISFIDYANSFFSALSKLESSDQPD